MPFVTKNFKIFLWGFAVVLLTACGNEQDGQRSVTAEDNVSVVTETNGTETSGFEDNATQIPETNTTVDENSTDEAGNTTEENTADERNTTIPDADTTPPVITLNGDANITLNQGEAYIEPGATAFDERDGNVDVEISGTVDTSKVGSYTVTYTTTDSAGNKAQATRTVRVTVSTLQLQSLNLEINVSTLNLGEQASLSVTGNYKDNTTQDLTEQAVWIITPQGSVEINGTTLTAQKDTNVTLQAKAGTIVSNTVNLGIYWEVNGHRLPPEPDKVLNDSTLLGIDVNNNGVRDDVERKVYTTYKKAIERAVMMQAFKTEQEMLADPDMVKNAREWAEKDVKAMDCDAYLYLNKQKPFMQNMGEIINDWQFNTEERVKKYFQYDRALSGGVYNISEGTLQDCEFDVEKTLEMDR